MSHHKNSMSLVLLLAAAGMLLTPAFLYLLSPGQSRSPSGIGLELVVLAALPFFGSLVAFGITKSKQLAFYSALIPLCVSVLVHLFVAIASRTDPFAGVLLYFAAWANLLVVFPLGLWVGLRRNDNREVAA